MTLFGYGSPAHQASMELDRVRSGAYAIASVGRPGDVVRDIETGNGVLAAHAAARRLFAIGRAYSKSRERASERLAANT